MNVFLWHVHGSWTTSFVQGPHRYLVPRLPDRSADGRGRALTWRWPDSVVEVSPEQAARAAVDVVVLQRPEELDGLAAQWLGGRVPGRELPALYLEHNAPQGRLDQMRHPVAGRDRLRLVHVSHFNDLFWDAGEVPTRVIEHGIVDPGYRYTGELARAAVIINEPVRRGRVTGTDLITRFEAAAPVDLFGMKVSRLGGIEDLSQAELHEALPRRRVYIHTCRWTSLGLSLLEAMHLGMPVVALAVTEAQRAVPKEAGVLSTCVAELVEATRELIGAPERARRMGEAARDVALERYGLPRFLRQWDAALEEVTR
jgi:glycosyltransferase involved in cell wall biosynthesis